MNAFAIRWLFSTNHKDIGTLYMIFGFFSGMIGTIVSIMLLAGLNVGLFYILSVLHLGICSSIFFIMLGFSVDLREAVFFTGLEVLCLLCFKTQDLLEHAHSIVQFVKQSVECLDTELLIVYYQISCLVLLLDSFSTWYWFTTIIIVLLPWICMKRHPNNILLRLNLFACMQPLLLLLRGVAFLRLGLCISVGLLLSFPFIPVAVAESDDEGESSPRAETSFTQGTSGDAPRGGSSSFTSATSTVNTSVTVCSSVSGPETNVTVQRVDTADRQPQIYVFVSADTNTLLRPSYDRETHILNYRKYLETITTFFGGLITIRDVPDQLGPDILSNPTKFNVFENNSKTCRVAYNAGVVLVDPEKKLKNSAQLQLETTVADRINRMPWIDTEINFYEIEIRRLLKDLQAIENGWLEIGVRDVGHFDAFCRLKHLQLDFTLDHYWVESYKFYRDNWTDGRLSLEHKSALKEYTVQANIRNASTLSEVIDCVNRAKRSIAPYNGLVSSQCPATNLAGQSADFYAGVSTLLNMLINFRYREVDSASLVALEEKIARHGNSDVDKSIHYFNLEIAELHKILQNLLAKCVRCGVDADIRHFQFKAVSKIQHLRMDFDLNDHWLKAHAEYARKPGFLEFDSGGHAFERRQYIVSANIKNEAALAKAIGYTNAGQRAASKYYPEPE